MNLKEEFLLLLGIVEEKTKKTKGTLAKEMGYGFNYISDIMTPSGKVTKKFIAAFKSKYANVLENTTNGATPSLDENLHLSVAMNVLIEDYSIRMSKLFPSEKAVNIRNELAQRTEMGIIQLMKK